MNASRACRSRQALFCAPSSPNIKGELDPAVPELRRTACVYAGYTAVTHRRGRFPTVPTACWRPPQSDGAPPADPHAPRLPFSKGELPPEVPGMRRTAQMGRRRRDPGRDRPPGAEAEGGRRLHLLLGPFDPQFRVPGEHEENRGPGERSGPLLTSFFPFAII